MNDLECFQPTREQFGIFWKYIMNPNITDIDYNGRELWLADLKKGHYKAKEVISEAFLEQFTHNIGNCVNRQFNKANRVLEADTRELRISILHHSVAVSGTSICIRKSPPIIRSRIRDMIASGFCEEKVLHLLINCVLAGMNFVVGGEPGHGKTEFTKFLMQFIPPSQRVITIEDSLEIHYSAINPGSDCVEIRVDEDFDYTAAIKACLRQNPKWLILSEARSVEVTSLLEQWSTGVKGFTTIHLDDLRKLPDRIQNMMDNVNDADRMENRIYRYVNVGVLVRKREEEGGRISRYMDQMCFYSREGQENKIYLLVKDGELISNELPPDIVRKMEEEHMEDPFLCDKFQCYIEEGR